MSADAMPGLEQSPVVVDLDGTLVRTDTLYESFLALVRRAPHVALLAPLWLLGGKARLKAEIARRIDFDATHLPYCQELVDYLREQKARHRPVILATAANERIAQAVAAHLGIFDRVIASDDHHNLRGHRKVERIRAALGPGPFEYAGNSSDDLHVWREAASSLLVNAPASVARQCEALGRPSRTFVSDPAGWRAALKLLRVHQWAKNVLVFLPLLAAHRAREWPLVLEAMAAFAAFCLCASSVYVLNDLLDLSADRRHARKRQRAFASGRVPLPFGLMLWPVLLAAAFAVAVLAVRPAFSLVLAAYWVSTLGYSLFLKRVIGLDVILLAGLYTVRMFGGTVATGVPTSSWMLSFSTFLFLSLALVKRLSEVRALRLGGGEGRAHGRGYSAQDYEAVGQLGSAAGLLSVLVLALYIQSDDVRRLYSHPERLWFLLPLLMYWLSRTWILAHRGKVDDDPVVYALKDPVSYVVALGAAVVVVLAS